MKDSEIFTTVFILLGVIIGIVSLVWFFIACISIANIREDSKVIRQYLTAWAKMNGFEKFNCKKCKKEYYGRAEKCPHCGDPKTYV